VANVIRITLAERWRKRRKSNFQKSPLSAAAPALLDVRCQLISFNRLPILAALFLAIATITSAASSPAAVVRSQSTPKIGQLAPTFTLRDYNGRRVSLADAIGTKVVLVFYRGYW
jgi:cytochrome oxidase Cu insertion factor (SCO1/SenC/PrrC family)